MALDDVIDRSQQKQKKSDEQVKKNKLGKLIVIALEQIESLDSLKWADFVRISVEKKSVFFGKKKNYWTKCGIDYLNFTNNAIETGSRPFS